MTRERLDAICRAAVRAPWQHEASVRRDGDGLRAGRVMLESVAFGVVREVAAALDVAMPEHVSRLAERAVAEGVPLIAGYDVGTSTVRAKLYVNASDAAPAVRARLCTDAVSASPIREPHVIGVDMHRDSAPTFKLYEQDVDAIRLASRADDASADRLARDASDAGACAGGVLSWDVDARGDARKRSFFVATRAGADAAIARLVSALPGWDDARAAALLPFEAGPARSIGIALHDPSTWTVYFKPRGVAPVASLEASARFRVGDVEVGVFVEPSEHVSRAFARTERHAITYRLRESAPEPRDVEALMAWAVGRVVEAERAGASPHAALEESAPPPPWQRVGAR